MHYVSHKFLVSMTEDILIGYLDIGILGWSG